MASLRSLWAIFLVVFSFRFVSSNSHQLCPSQYHLFLSSLQSQCSRSISPPSVTEVDGDTLDKVLRSNQKNAYTAVLFYASSCPFSFSARSTFGTVSSLFPQIRHLAVERSSAMPSLFSRYGIHSLPSLLMMNQTSKVRYYGSKDLPSLVQFYKKITGFDPVEYFIEDLSLSMGGSEKPLLQLLDRSSWKEMLTKEGYLIFSILFLLLRAVMYFCPGILSHLKSIWFLFVPHLNLGIFGETSQLLGRIFHMIDVRRIWSEIILCKTRNFHFGAKNAQVWASSLASMSLGESHSARLSTPGVS